MRRASLLTITRFIILTTVVASGVLGQRQENRLLDLSNGLYIFYQTFESGANLHSSSVNHKGNAIHRTILDSEGNPMLAFAATIEHDLQGSSIIISFAPIASFPFPRDLPPARRVANGDRVVAPLVVDKTGALIMFDTFQVGRRGTLMQFMPMPRTGPRMLPAGSLLSMKNPKFVDRNADFEFGEAHTLTSDVITMRIPKYGAFTFSSGPIAGSRMEAIADDKKIVFVVQDNIYAILCDHPVLPRGAWFVWVKYEGSSAPSSK